MTTSTTATMAIAHEGAGGHGDGEHGASPQGGEVGLEWSDYLEVVVLVLAYIVGLVGSLIVIRVSLRIRTSSRQIPFFFCGVLCADILISATRVPTTIYLIFSTAKVLPENVLSGAVALNTSSNLNLTEANGSELGSKGSHGVGGEGSKDEHHGTDVDMACEVWSASNALLITVVWLHLAVGVQRLAIIFSFSRYRKTFTQGLATAVILFAWFLGLVAVYAPIRAVSLPVERAGRGACRPNEASPEGVLVAGCLTTGLLALLPLLLTAACYGVVMRSVWLAREVRTESATEYNRVVVVTGVRALLLLLTYVPVCVLLVMDVRPDLVPDAARRYVGHLVWLQSVASPYVTLQDNDFRDKMMVPKTAAAGAGNNNLNHQNNNNNANGQAGGGGGEGGGGNCGGGGGEVVAADVMPDIGSSGGQDGEEHRARNLAEMKRERQSRRSTFKRGLSFITSADLRTIRGSSE